MVSVIIPAYNIAPFLERCVNSILNQTYRNLEVLLVDDGSTDDTPAICDRLAQQDARVRVFHKENGGVSSARNLALDNCRGDYISFIDGDDWVEPTLYEDAVNAMQENGVDVFMFEYFNCSTRNRLYHFEVFFDSFTHNICFILRKRFWYRDIMKSSCCII